MYVHTFSSSRSIGNACSISHTIARIQLTNDNYIPHCTHLTLLTHTLTCSHSSPLPQAVPGPGKYDIRSQFVHRQPHKDAAAEASLAPFGSSTKVCPRSSHVELSPVGDSTINSERLQSYVIHTYVSVCLCCYYVWQLETKNRDQNWWLAWLKLRVR